MIFSSFKQIKIAFKLLVVLTLLTGLIYPLAVTGLAQALFPQPANGSLIIQDGKLIGSKLIGQAFTDTKYFWGRPSATTPFPYNAENSSGSNLGPSNPALLSVVKDRVAVFQKLDPKNTQRVPVDLVTSSGSGLDPELSPLAAFYQVSRVAKARGLPPEKVQTLVESMIKKPFLGFIGESRINVLELNIALDKLTIQPNTHV